jgi:hypothetical protein
MGLDDCAGPRGLTGLLFFVLKIHKSHSLLEWHGNGHLECGLFYFRLIFLLYFLLISFRFFSLPLSLSSRYIVCINREPFLMYKFIIFYFNFFTTLSKKNLELDPKLAGYVSLSMRLSVLQIRINFLLFRRSVENLFIRG